jgi:hypothetical protein
MRKTECWGRGVGATVGLIQGMGEGLCWDSYTIPTRREIETYVDERKDGEEAKTRNLGPK